MVSYLYNLYESLSGPRNEAPKKVRDIFVQYGAYKVVHAIVCRAPIASTILSVIKILSFGQLEKILKQYSYDTLYHLYMILTIQGNNEFFNIHMEKNQVVEIYRSSYPYKKPDNTTCIPISVSSGNLTLYEFINNGFSWQEANTNKNFWRYNAKDNNCQVFVTSIIKGNKLFCLECGSEKNLLDFVNQNVDQLLIKPLFRLAEGITDLAATLDIVLYGKGI